MLIKVEFKVGKDTFTNCIELPIIHFSEIDEEHMSLKKSDKLIKKSIYNQLGYKEEDISSIKVKLNQDICTISTELITITKEEYNKLKEIEWKYNGLIK